MGCDTRKSEYSYQSIFVFQENLLFDEYHKLKLIDFGLCAKPKVSVKINTIMSISIPVAVLFCNDFHLIFIELSYIHFEKY